MKKPFIWANYVKNSKVNTMKYSMRKDTGIKTLPDGTTRTYLDDVNDDSDISLFYNGPGSITNVYMMRLAMLTKSRVYYAVTHEADNEQARIDMKEFEYFLNYKKIGVKKYGKSEIINVGDDLTGNIVDRWKQIIEENPNKKINIWWNGAHVFTNLTFGGVNGSNQNKIYELAGFKNVNIHLLEDGPNIWSSFNKGLPVTDEILYKSPKDLYERVSGYKFRGRIWMMSPSAFENVDSFYSDINIKKVTKKLHAHYIDPVHLNKRIFSEKFLDKKKSRVRLMHEWPLISGNDWRKALKILNDAKAKHPSKKSLIIMGSYGLEFEHDYIKYIWNKYHDKYNIFYKGHPGHSDESNWVKNEFNNNHKKTPIFVLEAMITSEELTRDHVAQGMKFDNFVSVESATGALSASAYDKSANDPKKDILEVYKNVDESESFNIKHVILNGDSHWPEVLKALKIT